MWQPSQKQVSLYNELVNKKNKVRKALLRRRDEAESILGLSRLPALVIPSKERRYHSRSRVKMSSKDFHRRLRELQKLYGEGLKSFYRATYKQKILEAWRDGINTARDDLGLEEIKPEGYFGKYSNEQIYDNEEVGRGRVNLADYLKAYNKMVSMSVTQFMDMYDSGMIPEFRYIYKEMLSKFETETSFLDMLTDSLRNYRRMRLVSKRPSDISDLKMSNREQALEEFINK